MKKLIFVSILTLILVSCKSSKQAGCDAYSLNELKTNTQHTTRSYPANEKIDMSNWSIFEQALYNTWDEMKEEDKKFFTSCLIGN
jgi:uncharacterized protein YcfL